MISHRIAIGMLIIMIFLTAKIWLWIYRNAFWIQVNRKIIFISLFFWGIAAWTILMFPKIMNYFWIESFTDQEFTWKTMFIFLGYVNVLMLAVNLILRSFSLRQIVNLIVLNLYFILFFWVFKNFNIEAFTLSVLLYYLFVAYGEETVKNQLAFSITNKVWQLESDLLLYHILIAIGFAFWENIVYLLGAVSFETFITTLIWGLWIVVLRWLLGFWAHTFYSSLIWMWNILWVLSIFLFILISILVHYGYDVALYFGYKIIIPIFILVMYFWISYIFYKIDRLYVEY
jgi:RsiW-degrading membrane proteinase PrsW (M82 family)